MKRPRWAQLYEELERQKEALDRQQTINKHMRSEMNLLRLQVMQQEAILRGKVGITEEEFTVALSEILRGKPAQPDSEPANNESIPAASSANHPSLESEREAPVPSGEPMPSEVLASH